MGWTFPMFYATVSYLLLLLSQVIYCNVEVIRNDKVIKTFDYEAAGFGGTIPDKGIQGQLIYLNPKENGSCHHYEPFPARLGPNDTWIALMKSRGCKFVHMILAAQKMNYSAVIVHNNASYGNTLIKMVGSTEDNQYVDEIVIPSVLVGYHDGLTMSHYDIGRITRYQNTVDVPRPRTTSSSDLRIQKESMSVASFFLGLLKFLGGCICMGCASLVCMACAEAVCKHPIVVRTAKFTTGDKYDVCPICLEDFVNNERLSKLPCDHRFHVECLTPCLETRKINCPVCRSIFYIHVPDPEMAGDG